MFIGEIIDPVEPVEMRHGLGTTRVRVRLIGANGLPAPGDRDWWPVDDDTILVNPIDAGGVPPYYVFVEREDE